MNRCVSRPRILLVGLLLCQACSESGEDGSAGPQATPLGPPEAVFPEDFGYVQAVRELRGGDVLVPDPLGNTLYRVDMDAGTRTVVGRVGEGPEEYRQPDAVWPLPGDSTLLVDLGNGRLVRLGPDLGFGAAHPIGRPQDDGSFVMALPAGVDIAGNVYAAALGGFAADPEAPGTILRIGLTEGTADTAGTYKRTDVVIDESSNRISISPIPLSPADAWGVAADGTVVVARSVGYGVDWHSPDGSVTRGDTVGYEPITITVAEMEEYFRDRRRHAGVGMSMTSSASGEATTTFYRGGSGRSEEPDYDNYSWPNVKPALHSTTVRVDPRGRAWVRRHVPAGRSTAYDLFDRQGNLVAAVTLDGDRRVAGFGAESVYMVSFTELDLAYLERYALPEG
ncbi:MAG: hypothetical protein OXH66_13430 [Gemmatimonadetes bacterium]|nr:hypothetical protein [Gemmatimonadota bacterium]